MSTDRHLRGRRTVTPELDLMRHSAAHLLAAAVQIRWPTAKFGVGPTTRDGFYYDIDLPEQLTPSHLEGIEKSMRELRNKKLPFERIDVPIDAAIQEMQQRDQPYKLELLRLLKEKGSTVVIKDVGDDRLVASTESHGGVATVSLYKTGDFVDLCRGPHVRDTSQIGPFRLLNVAGAYWRGSEANPQLQRVYGTAFETQAELDEWIRLREEAKKRDHRRLGKDLEIFFFSEEVGAGLPLWLPNGAVLRKELERLATEEERKDGYLPVSTPIIAREDLYKKSGHVPYYAEDMYSPIDIEGHKYYLRPMNCPHHHLVYGSRIRSYRDLPLRLSEYGLCYRYEASGVLTGLMRVRGFCQNDAHLYCRLDQAKEEFVSVLRLHARYYDLFQIRDYWLSFSLPDLNRLDKYIDAPDKWLAALAVIREAMEETGYPFEEREGEAAFYGPKIDFVIESAVGNEFAISTNQLDFLATERFNLTYVASDGSQQPVYVIHRAPLGSHERFVAFLIEHYGGLFPTWLAPMQVRIVPIGERHVSYAHQVRDRVFASAIATATGGVRVDVDDSSERLPKKIRNAQLMKIPYMLVIGDAEESAGTVSVRLRSGENLGAMSLETVLSRLKPEIESRSSAALATSRSV